MTNIKFSVMNFITINLMVAIMFVVFGLGKAAVTGSNSSGT